MLRQRLEWDGYKSIVVSDQKLGKKHEMDSEPPEGTNPIDTLILDF